MKQYIVIRICLIILFYGINQSISGQVDSLLNELKTAKGNAKVDVLNTLSFKYLDFSLDSSLLFASKAYTLAQQRNYTVGKAVALKQIGNYAMYQNNYTEALHYYDSALMLIRDDENELALVTTLMNNKGVVYDMMGNFTDALSIYNEALEIRKKTKDDKGVAQNLHNIGALYYQKGDYNTAIDYLLQSLKIEEKIGNVNGVGETYVNIGTMYSEIEEYEQSMKYLTLALSIFTETGSKNIVPVLLNLGIYHLLTDKNIEQSEEYLSKALEKSHELHEQYFLPEIFYNLGEVYVLKKNYDEAEKYIQNTLDIVTETGNNYLLSQVHQLMGKIQIEKGNIERAKNHFTKSLSIAEELGLKKQSAAAYQALAQVNSIKHNYKEAYNLVLKFADLKDSVFSEEKHKQIVEMQTKYDVEKKENRLVLLSKKNELQKLELKQSRTIFLSILISLTLLSSLFILLIQRKKLKANNQLLAIQQRLLRSQMNPHFIFNSISSIQNYIMQNNSLEASSYLSRFANLMRNILHQSMVEFISLSREIDMLEDYLKLQKLRLDNQLSYSIIIDETIDPETTAIPPLLIQPFVENAIEHGILKKESAEGRIVLRISLQEKELVFEIEDNGIGVKASANKKQTEHHSLATEIIKQRLKLLRKLYRKIPDVKIVDLADNTGWVVGTKVVINLPMKYLIE